MKISAEMKDGKKDVGKRKTRKVKRNKTNITIKRNQENLLPVVYRVGRAHTYL